MNRPSYWRKLWMPTFSALASILSLPLFSASDRTPSEMSLALPATDEGVPGAGPLRRADWFQDLWLKSRKAWAARVDKDQNALVFLGDSITQLWAGNLAHAFPGVKVANRGIGGDTTRGVLYRLGDVLALNPRGVVILIGTNDLEEGATPEVASENIRLILTSLHAHNATLPIVLCYVMPSSALKSRPRDKITRLNELIFSHVQDFPQVSVVDTWSLFANAEGDARPEEFPDLLHPNGRAYGTWAAALRPTLETLGLVPAWPDDFLPEPGFTSLFNGRDFTGWTDPEGRRFEDRMETPDSRFACRNGRLVVLTSRVSKQGRRILTTQSFPHDFVLKLEFRASPNADSGVFVRGPQLQCRDYPLAGPFLTLKHYRPLDWNELVITVRGGLAHATCNGEVLVDAFAVPADGQIGLESDRGHMEYRRIRISEQAR
ncbi:MAG TPA: GDSL-type esterase/lipase family protein [Opitutaceae bacterium]|nr:GDSL-type esterase/lipase family protein [Opitutaceae bacterium]